MLLVLNSLVDGYVGALEVPGCFSLREDIVTVAHEAGLDVRIIESDFAPTPSERAVVRSVLDLIVETIERRREQLV